MEFQTGNIVELRNQLASYKLEAEDQREENRAICQQFDDQTKLLEEREEELRRMVVALKEFQRSKEELRAKLKSA